MRASLAMLPITSRRASVVLTARSAVPTLQTVVVESVSMQLPQPSSHTKVLSSSHIGLPGLHTSLFSDDCIARIPVSRWDTTRQRSPGSGMRAQFAAMVKGEAMLLSCSLCVFLGALGAGPLG